MTQGDIIGLVASYSYAFGLLFIVEGLGKLLKWPQHVTRKLIHVGAGMWVWGIVLLFDTWYYGVIPFATFIVLNYVFYRYQLFSRMDAEDSSPGTVYFAISITILMGLLWRTGGAPDHVAVALVGIMAMTWGDAMANAFGMAYGKDTYIIFGHTRSWQGTAAMVIFSFSAMFLVLWLVPGSAISPASAAIGPMKAAIMAGFATVIVSLAEGVSPAGLDNLAVPLLGSLAVWLLMLL